MSVNNNSSEGQHRRHRHRKRHRKHRRQMFDVLFRFVIAASDTFSFEAFFKANKTIFERNFEDCTVTMRFAPFDERTIEQMLGAEGTVGSDDVECLVRVRFTHTHHWQQICDEISESGLPPTSRCLLPPELLPRVRQHCAAVALDAQEEDDDILFVAVVRGDHLPAANGDQTSNVYGLVAMRHDSTVKNDDISTLTYIDKARENVVTARTFAVRRTTAPRFPPTLSVLPFRIDAASTTDDLSIQMWNENRFEPDELIASTVALSVKTLLDNGPAEQTFHCHARDCPRRTSPQDCLCPNPSPTVTVRVCRADDLVGSDESEDSSEPTSEQTTPTHSQLLPVVHEGDYLKTATVLAFQELRPLVQTGDLVLMRGTSFVYVGHFCSVR